MASSKRLVCAMVIVCVRGVLVSSSSSTAEGVCIPAPLVLLVDDDDDGDNPSSSFRAKAGVDSNRCCSKSNAAMLVEPKPSVVGVVVVYVSGPSSPASDGELELKGVGGSFEFVHQVSSNSSGPSTLSS